MAYQKIVVNTGRALKVVASDTFPIPQITEDLYVGNCNNETASGTVTSNSANLLIDTGADFTSTTAPLPVIPGNGSALNPGVDRAFNTTANPDTFQNILVVADTQLTLNGVIFTTGTDNYSIIRQFVLQDTTKDFSRVPVGSIVYNTTSGDIAYVTGLGAGGALNLSANIFGTVDSADDSYKVFASSSTLVSATGFNYSSAEGCLLYVGQAASISAIGDDYVDVKVMTVGGDIVIFYNFPVGNYLPIQVVQLFETGSSTKISKGCLAIW